MVLLYYNIIKYNIALIPPISEDIYKKKILYTN